MRIVISESLWIPLPDGYGKNFEVVYDPQLAVRRDALLSLGQDTFALIVRNQTQVDEQLLDAYPNLRVVGRLGVGLDNIDISACRARGVQIISARGANAVSVAEYVLACMLHHARFLHRADDVVKKGRWDRSAATGSEIFGKTLGLIGVGDIGMRVASRARALGLTVMAYDPYVMESSVIVQDLSVQMSTLDAVVTNADYLSVHVPLTPATRHLLDKKRLSAMKEMSVLINTARGGIVDESALYETLRDHPQRMAYLDVREQEPPRLDNPLNALTNIILTPHIAGITEESSERVSNFILRQVEHLIRGEQAQGIV
ncbi:hypothetical protein AAC03nite_00430 [Alicyclobacillus acidoterrestris]|nr:hypothetical protein AAC03nite_00430 [Alicyclobacillus acidoterrestris]